MTNKVTLMINNSVFKKKTSLKGTSPKHFDTNTNIFRPRKICECNFFRKWLVSYSEIPAKFALEAFSNFHLKSGSNFSGMLNVKHK